MTLQIGHDAGSESAEETAAEGECPATELGIAGTIPNMLVSRKTLGLQGRTFTAITHQTLQLGVLLLQFFESFCLVLLQSTEFFSPAVEGLHRDLCPNKEQDPRDYLDDDLMLQNYLDDLTHHSLSTAFLSVPHLPQSGSRH